VRQIGKSGPGGGPELPLGANHREETVQPVPRDLQQKRLSFVPDAGGPDPVIEAVDGSAFGSDEENGMVYAVAGLEDDQPEPVDRPAAAQQPVELGDGVVLAVAVDGIQRRDRTGRIVPKRDLGVDAVIYLKDVPGAPAPSRTRPPRTGRLPPAGPPDAERSIGLRLRAILHLPVTARERADGPACPEPGQK
jgi:hypothetical protein